MPVATETTNNPGAVAHPANSVWPRKPLGDTPRSPHLVLTPDFLVVSYFFPEFRSDPEAAC